MEKIMVTRAIATVGLVDEGMYVFGFALMNEIIETIACVWRACI